LVWWRKSQRGQNSRASLPEEALEEADLEEDVAADDFQPFTCRKCGKRITVPGFEICPGSENGLVAFPEEEGQLRGNQV
jgi:hypothetical protein